MLFGFSLFFFNQNANAGSDYCEMLSFQESRLSSSQKQDLKKYGIIAINVEGKKLLKMDWAYYKKERLPEFLISKDMISDCETRIVLARHFDSVERFGSQYYKPDLELPDEVPPPFKIKPDFVIKHDKLIAELVYRFLSPHYYDYTNRLKGTLTEYEFPLLHDERIKALLSVIEKKLAGEGVKYILI